MIKYICLLACVATAFAASIGSIESTTEKKEIIPVLKFETDKRPDGSFSFSYEGGDKSFREESGVVENAGTEDEALEVSGSYRYIDADGREIEVHYTAGKNGFVPIGTNILSEISALAKAAADFNDNNEETELARKGRSKETDKEKVKKATKVEPKVAKIEKEVKVEKIPTTTTTTTTANPVAPVEQKPAEPKAEEKKPEEKTETTAKA